MTSRPKSEGLYARFNRALLLTAIMAVWPMSSSGSDVSIETAVKARVTAELAAQPMSFVANSGQIHPSARFYGLGNGHSFFFTSKSAVVVLREPFNSSGHHPHEVNVSATTSNSLRPPSKGMALALEFIEANPKVTIAGRLPTRARFSNFTGRDRSKWSSGLRGYGQVVYSALWPGVDAVFQASKGVLKSDFVLAPGAPVESIRLAYSGATGLMVDDAGNLLVQTELGVLKEKIPVSFQTIDGQRKIIDTRYVLDRDETGRQTYGFAVGDDYDPRYPLIIDPELEYSTLLASSEHDDVAAIAIDDAGFIYFAGVTRAQEFPVTSGVFDATSGHSHVFVARFDPDANPGDQLTTSIVFGGDRGAEPFDMTVDGAGTVYVTGSTNSTDFPTTAGAHDSTVDGSFEGFVAKISLEPTGVANLVSSTLLGGSDRDDPRAIAVDDSGNVYITGYTRSADFPVTENSFNHIYGGKTDVFVTQIDLDASGTEQVMWSTFVGGSSAELASDIFVDADGRVLVAGKSISPDFPTTAEAFEPTHNGLYDAFLVRLDPRLTGFEQLTYGTFLGGSGHEDLVRMGHDGAGNIYIVGETRSPTFPTTANALAPDWRGGLLDVFVSKLDLAETGANQLVASTFLGGSGIDSPSGITVASTGDVYLTGQTNSPDYPTTPDAYDSTGNGSSDAFVARLDFSRSGADQLVFSSYIGGSDTDVGKAIGTDKSGRLYVAGLTYSSDFPTTPDALSIDSYGTESRRSDVFFSVFAFNTPPTVDGGGPYVVGEGASITLTATGSDPDGDTLSYAWDLDGDGAFETEGQSVPFDAMTVDGPGSRTVTVRATDSKGGVATDVARINVFNVPPVVSGIGAPVEVAAPSGAAVAAAAPARIVSGPVDPVPIGADVTISGSFTDAGIMDRHSAHWDWGDGTTSVGTVVQGAGSGLVTDAHRYDKPGVYAVTLTIDDGTDQGSMTLHEVVVYDNIGGSVMAFGAFHSPAGAVASNSDASGQAWFALHAKFRPGAKTPTGRFRFYFRAGSVSFRSTGLGWLVVNGNHALVAGSGTLNGADGYAFTMSLVDQVNGRSRHVNGDQTDRSRDTVRITITNTTTGALVYRGAETSLRMGGIRIRSPGKRRNWRRNDARTRGFGRDDG